VIAVAGIAKGPARRAFRFEGCRANSSSDSLNERGPEPSRSADGVEVDPKTEGTAVAAPGPLHLEPSGFVPILVDSLSERTSPTATGTAANESKAALTSFGKLGFLVTPAMHRVVDEPTNPLSGETPAPQPSRAPARVLRASVPPR
jgi:hypothetical protein